MRIWIDDTGEKEYGPKTGRFFAYVGVAVRKHREEQVAESFNDLKRMILGTDKPEIKSNWLRIPKEVQRRYVEPFDLDVRDVDAFSKAFYSWLSHQPVMLLASVVDKELMEQKHGASKNYASSTSYEYLMQRYQYLLKEVGVSKGEVVIDEMMGLTPKGSKHRELLVKQHKQLVERGLGTGNVKTDRIANWVKFGGSHDYALLQVADLCAYNVMRQFRMHPAYSSFKKQGCETPKYEHFERILPKFRASVDGRIDGYGVVRYPK